MPLDREIEPALGVGRLQQVCPQGVVPGQRRRERVEDDLGRLGEQVRVPVAVVGAPGADERLEQVVPLRRR